MNIVFFVLLVLASLLLVLAVLAQHPKSGMAANFGASNQVMGARKTSDFLEKFTWGSAICIVILSLLTSMNTGQTSGGSDSAIIESISEESVGFDNINTIEVPSTNTDSL